LSNYQATIFSDGFQVPLRALGLALQPALAEHMAKQGITIPKKSVLYRFRVTADLCTMLFSRQYWMALKYDWRCHLRLDSSPQYGRDYLMAELDLVYTKDVTCWANLSEQKLVTRLLVGQTLGARSTSLAHKTRKILHMLSLESERLTGTLSRCCSILSDWGVEAGIWKVPAKVLAEFREESNYDTLFGLALFIPDGDHALHHALSCIYYLKHLSFCSGTICPNVVGSITFQSH
jgi:hypothetical protein